jgi:UDP-N-acetylglucosamine 3-dehydrogenase
MKIGLLSMAHIHAGLFYAPYFQQTGHLHAIWDDDEARGREAAATYGCRFEPDLAKLLRAVDGVVITTENTKHKDLAVAAARAGRHILCEKPLATTRADCLTMMEEARRAGVILMTAMPCRFHPAYHRIKAAVDNGEVGALVGIAATNQGHYPGGWFGTPELAGGGTVMDHTVHVADLLRHLTGSEVKSVYAVADRRFYPDVPAEDCGSISVEFENGVIATIDPSWSLPKPYARPFNVTMEVVGTQGTITVDMFYQVIDLWAGGNSLEIWGSNAYHLMPQRFVDACTKGAPVVVTGEDGFRAAEVAFLAYESIRQGKPVVRGA